MEHSLSITSKFKILFGEMFNMTKNLLANFFLYFLIWAGAVIALAKESMFLAILLILSGIAFAHKEHKKFVKDMGGEE